jgi:hypothetical protein
LPLKTSVAGKLSWQIPFSNYFFYDPFSQNDESLFSFRELAKKHTDISSYLMLLDEEVSVKEPTHPQEISKVTGQITLIKSVLLTKTNN